MIILITIGWLLLGLFAAWRWADDFGEISLFAFVSLTLLGAVAAFAAMFNNPPRIKLGFNINPIIWKRK